MEHDLYKACIFNDGTSVATVKRYITADNVNKQIAFFTHESHSIMWVACRYHRLDIVKWLVESVKAIITIDDLIQAICQCPGDIDLVRYLLECGANVGDQDDHGMSVLHWPHSTPKNIYEVLLRAGAKYNVRDEVNGCTPLDIALDHLRREVFNLFDLSGNIYLLLDAGARVGLNQGGVPKWVFYYQSELELKKERCVSAVLALEYCMRKRRGAPRDVTRYILQRYVLCTQLNDEWLNNK